MTTPSDLDAWFTATIAACPIPLPATDDDVAIAAYTDQVMAWVAEHDPEGLARHRPQLALDGLEQTAEEVLEELADSGEVDRYGVTEEGLILYQRTSKP